ncbi:hypothetical protein R1sor_004412 [Riccia sorocarpa]|uniref:Uncharacterized protein n=1 Tax=Riccia sorocarpa TaxID=122646 RepID=A0ABD3HKY0_9MARC
MFTCSKSIRNLTLEILWFGSLTDSDVYNKSDIRLSEAVVKTFSEGLVQTKCLRTVGVIGRFFGVEFADAVKSAFTADVSNTSRECSFGEGNFRSLMDLLQVNIYLKVADLCWVPDGKKVLVQDAMRRDREHTAYFSVLRDAKLSLEEAKAARVFLCGDPLAESVQIPLVPLNLIFTGTFLSRVLVITTHGNNQDLRKKSSSDRGMEGYKM